MPSPLHSTTVRCSCNLVGVHRSQSCRCLLCTCPGLQKLHRADSHGHGVGVADGAGDGNLGCASLTHSEAAEASHDEGPSALEDGQKDGCDCDAGYEPQATLKRSRTCLDDDGKGDADGGDDRRILIDSDDA